MLGGIRSVVREVLFSGHCVKSQIETQVAVGLCLHSDMNRVRDELLKDFDSFRVASQEFTQDFFQQRTVLPFRLDFQGNFAEQDRMPVADEFESQLKAQMIRRIRFQDLNTDTRTRGQLFVPVFDSDVSFRKHTAFRSELGNHFVLCGLVFEKVLDLFRTL